MSIPAAFASKVKCSAEGLPEPGLLIRNTAGQPECGKLNPNSTCLADQCCSPSGFCGPFVSNGVYNEGGKVVTKDEAVALYCTDKSQGDWRNWKSAGQCTDTGVRYPAGPDAPPLVVPKKTTSTTKTSTSTATSATTSAAGSTSSPTATPLPVDNDSGGIGVGAIVGILAGVIAVAAIAVYMFVAMRRKRMQKDQEQNGGKDILQQIDAMPNVITVDSDHHDSTSHGDLSSNRASAHHVEEDRMALNPAIPALLLPSNDAGSRPTSTAPSDARMSHLTSRKQRTASLQAMSATSAPEPSRTPSPAPQSPTGLDRAGTVHSTTAHVGTPTTAAPAQDPARLYLPPLPPMHGNDAVSGIPGAQARPLSAPPLDRGDSDLYLPPAVPLAPPVQLQSPADPSPGISLQLPEATMPRPSSPTRPTSMLEPIPVSSAGAPALARFTRAIESGALITGPRRCAHALAPTNPDELRLDVGDMVEVVRVFGDAWALGKVARRGDAEGFFPLAVLEPVEGDEVLLALHADLVGAASVTASTETTLGTSSGLGRTASLARRSQW
ncbi:hypothetical protein GGF32_007896 [Allomyces javanicus]|nr:hypothetical protein GGF32_007896 [Allomyces javanicus]